VYQACIAAALRAYETAGCSGLSHKRRWEDAVDAMRGMPLRPVVHALLHEGESLTTPADMQRSLRIPQERGQEHPP
jgi:hypothetical protein